MFCCIFLECTFYNEIYLVLLGLKEFITKSISNENCIKVCLLGYAYGVKPTSCTYSCA